MPYKSSIKQSNKYDYEYQDKNEDDIVAWLNSNNVSTNNNGDSKIIDDLNEWTSKNKVFKGINEWHYVDVSKSNCKEIKIIFENYKDGYYLQLINANKKDYEEEIHLPKSNCYGTIKMLYNLPHTGNENTKILWFIPNLLSDETKEIIKRKKESKCMKNIQEGLSAFNKAIAKKYYGTEPDGAGQYYLDWRFDLHDEKDNIEAIADRCGVTVEFQSDEGYFEVFEESKKGTKKSLKEKLNDSGDVRFNDIYSCDLVNVLTVTVYDKELYEKLCEEDLVLYQKGVYEQIDWKSFQDEIGYLRDDIYASDDFDVKFILSNGVLIIDVLDNTDKDVIMEYRLESKFVN